MFQASFFFRKSRCLFLLCILFFQIVHAREIYSEQLLQQLLAKNPKTNLPVQSIEELIPLLPKELRRNFTFVYNSRSPFKDSISPVYPRVILFTEDAKHVLTFTGDPKKEGYDFLETMTFQEDTAKFKFDLIALPEALKKGHIPTEKQKDCNHCHGEDARPIFDSYPLWPGFYGSIQDTFPSQSVRGKAELKNYQTFLNTTAVQGVYSKLIFPKGSAVTPYLNPEKHDPRKIEGNLDDFKYLPNTRLGMALTELNRQRIFRKMKQSPIYDKKEDRILAELLDCPNQLKRKKRIDEIQKEVIAEDKSRMKRQEVNPDDPNEQINNMQELKFINELEQVDWVSKTLNISREDWSMAAEANSLSFFDGILSGIYNKKSYYIKEDLIYEMMNHKAQKNPKKYQKYFQSNAIYEWYFLPFGNRIDIPTARKICQHLRP